VPTLWLPAVSEPATTPAQETTPEEPTVSTTNSSEANTSINDGDERAKDGMFKHWKSLFGMGKQHVLHDNVDKNQIDRLHLHGANLKQRPQHVRKMRDNGNSWLDQDLESETDSTADTESAAGSVRHEDEFFDDEQDSLDQMPATQEGAATSLEEKEYENERADRHEEDLEEDTHQDQDDDLEHGETRTQEGIHLRDDKTTQKALLSQLTVLFELFRQSLSQNSSATTIVEKQTFGSETLFGYKEKPAGTIQQDYTPLALIDVLRQVRQFADQLAADDLKNFEVVEKVLHERLSDEKKQLLGHVYDVNAPLNSDFEKSFDLLKNRVNTMYRVYLQQQQQHMKSKLSLNNSSQEQSSSVSLASGSAASPPTSQESSASPAVQRPDSSGSSLSENDIKELSEFRATLNRFARTKHAQIEKEFKEDRKDRTTAFQEAYRMLNNRNDNRQPMDPNKKRMDNRQRWNEHSDYLQRNVKLETAKKDEAKTRTQIEMKKIKQMESWYLTFGVAKVDK